MEAPAALPEALEGLAAVVDVGLDVAGVSIKESRLVVLCSMDGAALEDCVLPASISLRNDMQQSAMVIYCLVKEP